jgi:hypothetical protein
MKRPKSDKKNGITKNKISLPLENHKFIQMRTLVLVFFFVSAAVGILNAQNLPEGYILQYQQSFDNKNALGDFDFGKAASWQTTKTGSNSFLKFNGSGEDSVVNIAVLQNKVFGDFIMEVSVMPGMDSSGTSGVCIFIGLRDSTRYYYVQLDNKYDIMPNGIFILKNNEVRLLSPEGQPSITLNDNKWHKVRIERNIVRRTILVYTDNAEKPVLQVKDYELIMGSIGFGSFNTEAKFDNIKIWAPTVISEPLTD